MHEGTQNNWQVVAVVILKDEATYIDNWLLFHLSIGFEHFLLYDNNSSDHIRDALAKYISGGVVTYISWPLRAGQIDAYNHALRLLTQKSEWIAFLDVDEYVVLHRHATIDSFLSSLDADQILLPWRNFPYSGHQVVPGGSDLENYFWAHKVTPATFVQVKHLVRANAAIHVTAHFSFVSTGKTMIADGTLTAPTHIVSNPTYEGAQINHYATRSFFENSERLRKGQVDGGAEKRLPSFVPLSAETAAHLDYDASIVRHFQGFSRERERWARIAATPHRFGLMQKREMLRSWNNVPYFFCKSFLNYLAGSVEIAHGTQLEPVQQDMAGKEQNLRSFWGDSKLECVHFRVDQRSFIPFFMGSVHYGDFVRRFGFEARFVAQELSVRDNWSFSLDCAGSCLASMFDLASDSGIRITATVEDDPVIDYSVPSGNQAVLIYRPVYLLDSTKVCYTIHSPCRVQELILGTLP